jgi:hypothetical protein
MKLDLSIIMTVEEFISNTEFKAEISKGTLKESFFLEKNRKYNIPAYQREIRWKPQNIRTLYDDVNEDDKFLGNIFISMNAENTKEFDIIDGQQRLTAFFLMIHVLISKGANFGDLVEISNKSISSFDEMIEEGFDDTKLRKKSNYKDIIEGDVLDQRESLKLLYDEVNKFFGELTSKERELFEKRLLKSKINVIMSKETDGNLSNSICVDYYIDVNDKSVKLDSIDIMKAQLFRKNFIDMTSKWEKVQKELKSMRINGAKYSLDDFYFHFFACTINEYYEYKLKTLNRTLKVLSNVNIGKEQIKAGTHIIEGVLTSDVCNKSDKSDVCNKSMEKIEKCSNFFSYIMKCKGKYTVEFKKDYLEEKISEEMAKIIFHLITVLLKIDNEVPKILITKYYLDIILEGKKDKYDLIFDIYVASILFNVVSVKKKNSTKFVGIVMQQSWDRELKKYSEEKYKNEISEIEYTKPVKENKKVTGSSGQYIPKHIFAIRQFLTFQNTQGMRCYNKHSLCQYLDESDMTAEHFFVNQSYKITFKYGKDEKTASIPCPGLLKKYISYPVNYLYIKKLVNSSYGDAAIWGKIEYLKSKDESVFACKMVYAYFLEIEKVFNQEEFPDLSKVDNKSKAVRQVREYYKNVIPKKIQEYIKNIRKINVVYDKSIPENPWRIE